MKRDKNVRVRIAPSPTGFLHVGTARAALYNWLFAKKHKGTFILRVEDTDLKRSSKEMIESILEGLRWLGLDWDEGPFYQSERLKRYESYAQRLLSAGKAYYCYCTPEELAERREQAKRKKSDVKYDRRCLQLTEEEKRKNEEEGRAKALRFLVPEGETVFEDVVHGSVRKHNSDIEDFVIMKSDGTPTYNLAVVVDDHEMGISHIIRGDDHIPNTPKQVLLYEALDLPLPVFAHLPLILGEDKSKLSKRHGAVSVLQYRDEGFLEDALFNFLALLGWNPGDDVELMTREEITDRFSLDRINRTGAVFDIQKLEWMNGAYIGKMDNEALLARLLPFIEEETWFSKSLMVEKRAFMLTVIDALKPRMRRLTDFSKYGSYFFSSVEDYEEKGVKKHFGKETATYLEALKNGLEKTDDFGKENIEQIMRSLADVLDVKAAKLIHPTRLAVTGMTVGPGLFDILEILGKERVINRLTRAIKYINLI
jgi:nondiscriminating glutamyl-tRNA synthetase